MTPTLRRNIFVKPALTTLFLLLLMSLPGGSYALLNSVRLTGAQSFAPAQPGAGITPAAVHVLGGSSAHTPSVTDATTNEDTQTTSGLVVSRNPLDGAEVTHFKIGNIVGGQLFKNDGTTPLPINSFITFAEGNAGLKFTPSLNNWGGLTIEVYSSTSASDAGVGGIAARPFITVTPLGDTPSITTATTNQNTQSRFGLKISRNPVDTHNVTYKITNIQNGTLFKHDGTTQINAGDFLTFDEGGAGLKFTPANNLTSPSSVFSFDVQASSSGTNAGLGGGLATGSVGVYLPITVIVNTLGDVADSNIGDGHCDTDGNLGNGDQCTLRAAIQETNSAVGDDTITFSLPANSTITLNTALPDLESVTITGPGATLLTVQRSTAGGTADFRVFTVSDEQGAILSGLTVSNGRAVGASFPAGAGGGILNNTGSLVVSNCIISGNTALGGGGLSNLGTLTIESSTVAGNSVTGSGGGGGISNSTGATQSAILTISNSTISNNNAATGGGIYNIGHAFVTNSTISSNTAAGTGGGISNFNPATLTNVTVTGNAAGTGGGIYNPGIGTILFGNTIIAGNAASTGPDCSGFNFGSQDYNLIGNTSDGHFGGVTTHDITNVNALLGPLAANGGPTSTHALLVGSPAIDAGNSAQTADQRGQPRPIDNQTVANAAGGNASDIGAYEAHNLEVNTIADADDGLCRALGTGNGCTLREAIIAANAEPGAESISFAPALTSSSPNSIVLLSALPDLSSDMTISGSGSFLMTVQRTAAGGDYRIFTISSGRVVVFSGFVIYGGRVTGNPVGDGGGISNSGTLTVNNCIVAGNSASGLGGGIHNTGTLNVNNSSITSNEGGGIANDLFGGTPTTTINNSVISSNFSHGGVYNNALNATATLTINNSTISGNAGVDSGGGVSNFSRSSTSRANATINNSTISGNAGGGGGGLSNGAFFGSVASTMTINNSTISGNGDTSNSGGAGIRHFTNGSGSAATLTITNTTITGNAVGPGGNAGGILIEETPSTTNILRLRNTIVAGNIKNTMTPSDIFGRVDSSGSFNLIGEDSGLIGLTNGTNGNQIGTAVAPINPQLGPLANNGGPTQTHALLFGSPATDAGDNCVLNNSCSPTLAAAITTDQRGAGFNRAADGNGDGTTTVDIGAFEFQSVLVTNTNDSGAGSLRQAILDANANSGIASINFQSGLNGAITLLTALPDISTNVSIAGPGANLLTVQRSTAGGTANFRIFTINSGKVVKISGLTLSNGSAPTGGVFPADSGGAILNLGSMELSNMVVSGNTAPTGGGISSSGPLTLKNTIVSGNTASSGGGGISTQGGSSPITIVDSTISGNTTNGSGGGILNSRLAATMTLTINNSTISGNSAIGSNGGGIYNSGTQGAILNVTMTNVTISGNTSGFGGGIANSSEGTGTTVNLAINNGTVWGNSVTGAVSQGGGIADHVFGSSNTLTLRNTIVAANFANSGASNSDISSLVHSSSSFNLIGDGTGMSGISNGPNGNIIGTAVAPIAPRVNLLANNGGPTQTHALLPGSPALDAGNNALVTNPPFSGPPFTDQRGTGFARIVDGPDAGTTDTVDIGAFEAQVSVADIADQTINEDASLSLPFNVGGGANITGVTASSSNTTLVPNLPANITISGSGSTRTLTINPAGNLFGTSTITVTVNGNNSQAMTDTFVLTVNSVNDAPSFTKGVNQTVNENDGAQTITNWATGISAGPTNESGQTVNFVFSSNSNPALFAVAPAVSPSGTLTYTPAAGASGSAVINVALMDNGGTANGGSNTSAAQTFIINVREGGALRFSAATYSVAEDGANAVVTVTRTGGTAGEARVNYATSNGTATAGQDYTAASGTLTFADGVTSQSFNVAITNDAIDEPDETVNLTLTSPAGSGSLGTPATAVLAITDNDPPPGALISFSQANYTVSESGGFTTITVTRSNDLSAAVTVDYATAEDSTVVPCATANSIASSRCDFTTAVGTLRFAAGESSQTFLVLISQDNYVEGPETVAITLSNPTGGAALATPSTATLTITDDATEPATNPIDTADAFVRQHYHDFLNREPDAPGLAFWSNQITECQQPGATCSAEVRRINVSAAFFLSIEFQETGYLVYRTYKSAYGNLAGTPVPLRLNEFLPDTQQIGKGVQVGVGNWETLLEANKVAFALDFVSRARFTSAYPTTLTPAEFVDALFAHGGVTPSAADRDAAIAEFGGAGNTADTAARARALRRVAENETLKQQEFNRAFVLMQYFGYLRRNPNDAPEANLDFGGYNFWLGKLNEFNGNFVNAEMVKAFLVSGEYRGRFGP